MSSEKRTWKQDGRTLARGIKLAYRICPTAMIYQIAHGFVGAISPYFSLYMSSLLVNGLAAGAPAKELLKLAAVSVTGLFSIGMGNHVLAKKNEVWFRTWWISSRWYFAEAQNRMKFAHLENPDVILLREEIDAAENATGAGVHMFQWSLVDIMGHLFGLLLSLPLVCSMFFTSAKGSFGGFSGFVNSPYASILLILLIAADAVIAVRLTNRKTELTQKEWEHLAESNTRNFAFEELRGSDVIMFNMKRVILHVMKEVIRPQYVQNVQKISSRYDCLLALLKSVLNLAVFLFTAGRAFVGAFGIGNFILYQGTVSRFVGSAAGLSAYLGMLRHNSRYLEKQYEFLDLPNDMYQGKLAVEKRDDIDYEIEFRDVSFRYPRSETWVLRHVNMKFKIGDRLAIVGENGSGKTTFIKLLCRLYDPTEGTILLNGIDITRYRHDEYMALFSVVFQDYKLFPFSLAANVTASHEYDAEKAEDCLRRAGLAKCLSSLERGIETAIGRQYENDGIDLSGGEAQKVALARALYKDAPFVVLDEPTAALDPIAEAAVYESFNQILENKTSIFISHRLSSCRFCDEIAVFENGQIVQRGTHEALVEADGKYRELWNAQAQYYREEEPA